MTNEPTPPDQERAVEMARVKLTPWMYRMVRTQAETFIVERALPDATGGPSWRQHTKLGRSTLALLEAWFQTQLTPAARSALRGEGTADHV